MDTLSRLKGIETHVLQCFSNLSISLDTLSRLKGIETAVQHGEQGSRRGTLDLLSRLKGIETLSSLLAVSENDHLQSAFPFEGN